MRFPASKSRTSFSAVIAVLAIPSALHAQVPRTIAFQGVLTNSAGVVKPNGSYNVTFRLYDALSGGSVLWTETNKPVTVAGGRGMFATSLGTPTSFGTLAFDKPYYLEVQPTGEAAAMTPRVALQSVPYALNAWSVSGNAGTNPAANFLGTTDAQPLVIKANGHRVAQYQDVVKAGDTVHAVNIIAGSEVNAIAPGVVGSVIAGGGGIYFNDLHSDYSVIGGGAGNYVDVDPFDVIAGGENNIAFKDHSTVGGGNQNHATGAQSTVAGGTTNDADGDQSTVGGGSTNSAAGQYNTVAGGDANSASDYATTIGGGVQNTATDLYATVPGGVLNHATAQASVIAGGRENNNGGWYAAIGGGYQNVVTPYPHSNYAVIGGGLKNEVIGDLSTIPGGYFNLAVGKGSFAAGNRAVADHDGSFVWSDESADADFDDTGNNQFCVRAVGGVVIETGADALIFTGQSSSEQNRYLDLLNSPVPATKTASGLKAGGILCADDYGYANPAKNNMVVKGTLGVGYPNPSPYTFAVAGSAYFLNGYATSDARFKKDIVTLVNPLDTVAALRGVTFNWDREDWKDHNFPEGRQVGFIAQEVEKTLPELVSTDNSGYKAVNYQGVVPVLVEAVKTLKDQNEELAARNQTLEARNDAMESRLNELAAAVAELRKNQAKPSTQAVR